jgi:hypothetical protein
LLLKFLQQSYKPPQINFIPCILYSNFYHVDKNNHLSPGIFFNYSSKILFSIQVNFRKGYSVGKIAEIMILTLDEQEKSEAIYKSMNVTTFFSTCYLLGSGTF